MDIKQGDAAAIIQAAREGQDARVITIEHDGVKAPVLMVPNGGGAIVPHDVSKHLDAYRDHPVRREGTARLDDLASFIAHANRFKDADSAIFISGDPAKPSFLAVLDYHEARHVTVEGKDRENGGALPRFGKHRGAYVPVFSDEWKAWTAASGKDLTQGQFAALIQSRARDVFDVADGRPGGLGDLAAWFAQRFGRGAEPARFFGSSSRMLELSEGLTATVTDRVGDVSKLNGGATKITFESDVSTDVEIPPAFLVEIPVFRGGDLWQLPVRLRFTLRKDGDTKRAEWRIELFGVEQTIAAVVKDMGETVRQGTELPVFVGAPEN